MSFQDKVCVVTGGANGIGRCIAESFLEAGARVAVIDVDEAAGQRLAARFAPDRLFVVSGDLVERQVLDSFAARVIDRFGQIDCLINNACISKRGILSGCSYDDFNTVLHIGVTAPYWLTKLFLDVFRPGASIVNIASTRAAMSQADTESYTAAKGGISALTHGLAVSLAGRVRVNSISPGWIDTGAWHEAETYLPDYSTGDILQHPAGRVGNPPDIASMVLFLCSEEAGFITGENIVIDGGMTRQMIYHQDNGWVLCDS